MVSRTTARRLPAVGLCVGGGCRAAEQFLLTTAAQNLKRLAVAQPP